MARAVLNGTVLAESDKYEVVEGNVYFPPDSVNWDYFKPGDRQYTCPWKGESKYWDIVAGDKVEKNTAWTYPEPKEAAANIKGHMAFHQGAVKVEN